MATSTKELPVIALTPGDCTGIGPEQMRAHARRRPAR